MNDNKTPSYELIIFDWDGTLIDSQAHIVHCLTYAIDAVGAQPLTYQEMSHVIGLGLYEALAALLPEADKKTVNDACNAYRDKFLSAEKSPSILFPDVTTTLSALKDAGYFLAVATGKSRRGLEKDLSESGIADLFSATRCADETRSKPHPQMLEEILTDMDTPASQAVMIGDTHFDLQMAFNIGMSSIGVSYGVHDSSQLEQYNPLTIVHSIKEIETWFKIYQ